MIKQFHQYQLNIKKERRLIFLYQLLICLFFFGSWELLSRYQLIDPLLFSSPTKILDLGIQKWIEGSLLFDLFITVVETIAGFIFGTLLGTILATSLWWFPRFAKVADPFLVILNAMPKVALGPLIIVLFGPGFLAIMAMGIIISVIITSSVIYTAFVEVDQQFLKIMKSFGATKFQIFKGVVLPACTPVLLSTLKVNVGLSWVGVIVGEFLASSRGLGYYIMYGFQVFNFTLVLLSLILIAIVATIMYKIVSWIEKGMLKKHGK